MPSLHKYPGTANWICAFTLPDGRRTKRSTGTSDRKKAWQVCLRYSAAADRARAGRLNISTCRGVLSDLLELATGESLASDTVADYSAGWLRRKAHEIAEGSVAAYEKAVEHLKTHLGDRVGKPLDQITRQDAARFRDALAAKLAAASANKYLKIVRVLWNDARRDGAAHGNPFADVRTLKVGRSSRRPYTMDELRRVLAVCSDEWKGMVLVGLYTGARISDVAALTWRNVDLPERRLVFVTGKTDRPMSVPMAVPVERWLLARPAGDNPGAPVFPSAFGKGTNSLSVKFNELLVEAGLAPPRNHKKSASGKGRGARRRPSVLGFHALRHTATSLLKNAGVSDVVARELIGHDSEAVSRQYTHIEEKSLREAVEKMPDVTTADDRSPPLSTMGRPS